MPNNKGLIRWVWPLLGWAIQAQELGEAEILKAMEQLMNVPVFSASRLRQDAKWAPAKVVVITAADLGRRGYLDLEEVLHDLAGFDFEKGFGSHWSQIYMRGERSTNSDRFLFIWDGVIQNDIWAQVTWFERQFPLSAIDRIEVMYGPASLLYGSNAMSGIIQVFTKQPEDLRGFSVQAKGGSFETRSVELVAGRALGDWRFGFIGRSLQTVNRDLTSEWWTDNAGRRRYYGLRNPEDYDLTALTARGGTDRAGVTHQEYEPASGTFWATKNGYWVPFDGRFGRRDPHYWFVQGDVGWREWNLKAISWIRQDTEDGWTTPQSLMGANWNSGGNALQLSHERDLSNGWFSKAQLLARSNSLESNTEEPDFGRTPDWNTQSLQLPKVSSLGPFIQYKLFNREYRASEVLSYKGESLSGVAGVEFIAAKVYENYYTRLTDLEPWKFKPQHEERNLAVFANGQLSLNERISLAGGVRLDHNWEAGGVGGFGNLVTSRAAVIFSPSATQVFKVIAGQAFQAPTAFQKYSTNPSRPFPSPNLKPERLSSLELGWEVSRPSWKGTVNTYLNQVENKIQLVPIPNTPQGNHFENKGRLEIFGLEAESRWFLDPKNSWYLNITANSAKDKDTGRRTGGIAPFQTQAGVEMLFRDRLGVSLRGRWVARRDTARWDDPSLLAVSSVGAYATADLSLVWYRVFRGFDLRLSAFNLGNTRYYDPGVRSADGQYYNGAILQQPFRAFLGVDYRF